MIIDFKKPIVVSILLLTALNTQRSSAQHIYVEQGKNKSNFKYINPKGEPLDHLLYTSNDYMAIGIKTNLLQESINLSFGLNYTGYGALGNDLAGNLMEWGVFYSGLDLGIDLKLTKIGKGVLYTKGNVSWSRILHGYQLLNNQIVDLKRQPDFSHSLVFPSYGFGLNHPINNNLSLYIQYMRGKSLTLLEKIPYNSDKQELRIVSESIGFGLMVDISNKK
jgi:hypothetical protein